MTKIEMGEIWKNALGRYDRAMQYLVENIFCRLERPIWKLLKAVMELKTPSNSKYAADSIQKGYI